MKIDCNKLTSLIFFSRTTNCSQSDWTDSKTLASLSKLETPDIFSPMKAKDNNNDEKLMHLCDKFWKWARTWYWISTTYPTIGITVATDRDFRFLRTETWFEWIAKYRLRIIQVDICQDLLKHIKEIRSLVFRAFPTEKERCHHVHAGENLWFILPACRFDRHHAQCSIDSTGHCTNPISILSRWHKTQWCVWWGTVYKVTSHGIMWASSTYLNSASDISLVPPSLSRAIKDGNKLVSS